MFGAEASTAHSVRIYHSYDMMKQNKQLKYSCSAKSLEKRCAK